MATHLSVMLLYLNINLIDCFFRELGESKTEMQLPISVQIFLAEINSGGSVESITIVWTFKEFGWKGTSLAQHWNSQKGK